VSESLEIIRAALAAAGSGRLAAAPELAAWHAATERLLASQGSAGVEDALASLARLERLAGERGALAGLPRERWALHLTESGAVTGQGLTALAHLLAEARSPEAALAAAGARELAIARLLALPDQALQDRLVSDTDDARALLDALRDAPPRPLGARLRRLAPLLAALAAGAEPRLQVEHERAPTAGHARREPLLDHLADRVLGRKLAGLERGDRALFQRDEALSGAAFAALARSVQELRERGLLDAVRAALVHLDFAKGGLPAQREHWRASLGADLTVHNTAARRILEREAAPGHDAPGALAAFTALRARPAVAALVLALVESHGLAGQAVRGETPLALFAAWVRALRADAPSLAEALHVSLAEARRLATLCLHVVNAADTAGVREGLLDDALLGEMRVIADRALACAEAGSSADLDAIRGELRALEERLWEERLPSGDALSRARARLADRLARLRKGRIHAGEPRAETERAVEGLAPETTLRLSSLLASCQLWYAEAASAALSPLGQAKVLAIGAASARAARPSPEVTLDVSLEPLVAKLHRASGDPAVSYRVRLLEALLAATPLEALLDGAGLTAGALGAFETEIGGGAAIALDYEESAEARALLTLLPIYETKSSAAFHTTLKTLCDVYGLRKDEFDRISNEAIYLEHMNSARSDKARMLDHARPGRIVEVGPGGGVVLDLLEERFATSEVIGVDISQMVVEALQERKRKEGRRWSIVLADAFKLPDLHGPASLDTVVYCSILHEIYSYVPWTPDEGGEPRLFRRESVRELLRATYRALVPGGRIVIRDGVLPPEGARTIRFLAKDAEELFHLFVKQFQGRPIRHDALPDGRVRLTSGDAMEFLYKLTWGAASFPYEIREQYGVMTYEEYRARALEWLADEAHPPRWIPLPPEERSYLQPGYRTGLAGKVELQDGEGAPCELPDSNAIWVFEKT